MILETFEEYMEALRNFELPAKKLELEVRGFFLQQAVETGLRKGYRVDVASLSPAVH